MAMRWRLNGCKVLAAYLPVLDTYFFTDANTYIGVSATGCGAFAHILVSVDAA